MVRLHQLLKDYCSFDWRCFPFEPDSQHVDWPQNATGFQTWKIGHRIGGHRTDKRRNALECATTAPQYNTMQDNIIQYNTIQYNTIQYNALMSSGPRMSSTISANSNYMLTIGLRADSYEHVGDMQLVVFADETCVTISLVACDDDVHYLTTFSAPPVPMQVTFTRCIGTCVILRLARRSLIYFVCSHVDFSVFPLPGCLSTT